MGSIFHKIKMVMIRRLKRKNRKHIVKNEGNSPKQYFAPEYFSC